MPHNDTVGSLKNFSSFGYFVFDHLAADAAGLTCGQVAIVALLKVYANLVGGFHLELLKSLLSLLVKNYLVVLIP